ncbi:MAG: ABC transporter substrate-binding protein, partial [Alphaproteobacteria bacterium]|nr:ABC transporter substrate-binding protein [Alphaproteobacteria bacterium]
IMAVFNNLVMYKQDEPLNSLATIVPDLAERWDWADGGTVLRFHLRRGVRWHDGKPFTARDVKCTWDMLLGKTDAKMRLNPRQPWYHNLREVVVEGDDTVRFVLGRPQPALIALLASGYSAVYPCHVSSAEMRRHPIGTGPFKFVAFKPNESIKLTRNRDYWKPGRPYLDGIEYAIIPNRATALLAFVTKKFDMTFPYDLQVPMLKDLQRQAPQAICEMRPTNVSRNLLINRDVPPFDDPEIRRAIALALDRKAFIDILTEGAGDIGGAMLPPPEGQWGMPAEILETLPGYGPDIARNRAEARALLAKHGYGADKRLKVKVSTRNIAQFRDPAVLLMDQLKEITVESEIDVVETAVWYPKLLRRDYVIALNLTGSSVDDPDQHFYEHYVCDSPRNYPGYCNKEVDALIDQQSREPDRQRRKELVWEIDRRLQEDVARPIIFHGRSATCWHPQVKGLTTMANSIYNGWRYEDVWLDQP